MTSNVDEWVLNVQEHLTTAVDDSLQVLADHARQLMIDYTYPNRKKTRRAVRAFVKGRRIYVGLYFGKKYTGNRNTFTHRHFRDVWRNDVRPLLVKRYPRILNHKLQR